MYGGADREALQNESERLMATDLGFTLGGIDFIPAPANVDPNENIIRPELQDGPLAIDELMNILKLFAGGNVGGGVQNLSGNLDPNTTASQVQISPVIPSGVFTPAGDNANPDTNTQGPQAAPGKFNLSHMFEIQNALNQMNPGMTNRVNAGQIFESAGLDANGRPTMDFVKGNAMSPEFMGPAGGLLTTLDHPQTGNKWTVDQMIRQAAARIANLDYSGGDSGGDSGAQGGDGPGGQGGGEN